MKLLYHIVPYLYFGWVLWRLVLRGGAYPPIVPPLMKYIHVLVLFCVMAYAWLGAIQVPWLIRHPDEIYATLTAQQNSLAARLVGVATAVWGISCLPLILICINLAQRRESCVRWYIGTGFAYLLSSTYLTVYLGLERHYTLGVIIIGTAILLVLFISSVVFYLVPSVRSRLFANENLTSQP